MSQAAFNLPIPLTWTVDKFWGRISQCRRFAITEQQRDGQPEFFVWHRGEDGRVIPKCLGIFQTWEMAVEIAERAAYQ